MNLQQRFARLATTVVVRAPFAWRLFRRRMATQFDALAPVWDATRVDETRLRAIRAALAAIDEQPARALDVGTGTGRVARIAAELWPAAEVVGVDVSPAMVAESRRLAATPRERYEVADSSALPFADGFFAVVAMNNMIPFFDEVARVTAPGGYVAIAFGLGPSTPIWVPLERVRRELERRGFVHVAAFSEPPGLALLARKSKAS
ncbi:MAG: class I SAM-dependent methyltransferase [Gaiellaceae bacterium]